MPATLSDPTLTAIRGEQADRDAAEIRMLQAVVDWAVAHPGSSPDRSFEERALFLAGEGAPSVAEFATYELAAALGMSTDAGTTYVGRVLELRYRLPGIWARVMAGEVPPGGPSRSPTRPATSSDVRRHTSTRTSRGSCRV